MDSSLRWNDKGKNMDDNIVTKHFYISGKVQGVFFRAKTHEQAYALGVTGWVRNLRDGRVEAVASADDITMQKFESWLSEGPKLARVDNIEDEVLDTQTFDRFDIR